MVDTPAGATWTRNLDIVSLLGRSPLPLDLGIPRQALQGATVLVTGAGGSIGVALSQALCQFVPGKLILLDNHEPSLFALQQQLANARDAVADFVLADVRDKDKMARVCNEHRPEYVFHLAAYKHVPLGELNPDQVIATNVLGTRNVGAAAVAAGCRRLVYPSTDKAVDPVNVYGASKRAAELHLMSCQAGGSTTSFAIARLVNTIGAQGGVIRLFAQQVEARQPLTLTHPEMTRYWISMEEAVSFLLLVAVAEAVPGAFILDLGEPVHLMTIAKRLASLVAEDGGDPQVQCVGLRPGERLFELLASADERVVPTAHAGVLVALPARALDLSRIADGIRALEDLLPRGDTDEIVQQLHAFVRAQGGIPES